MSIHYKNWEHILYPFCLVDIALYFCINWKLSVFCIITWSTVSVFYWVMFLWQWYNVSASDWDIVVSCYIKYLYIRAPWQLKIQISFMHEYTIIFKSIQSPWEDWSTGWWVTHSLYCRVQCFYNSLVLNESGRKTLPRLLPFLY